MPEPATPDTPAPAVPPPREPSASGADDGRSAAVGAGARTASEYALLAVVIGLIVLGALDAVVLLVYHQDAEKAVALIGAIDSPISVLVSAYFGMKVGTDAGAAGKAEAERGRSQANREALALAAHLPPETARPALRALGIPVPEEPA